MTTTQEAQVTKALTKAGWRLSPPCSDSLDLDGVRYLRMFVTADHPDGGSAVGVAAHPSEDPTRLYSSCFNQLLGQIAAWQSEPPIEPSPTATWRSCRTAGLGIAATKAKAELTAASSVALSHQVLASWYGRPQGLARRSSAPRGSGEQVRLFLPDTQLQWHDCTTTIISRGHALVPKSPAAPVLVGFGSGCCEAEADDHAKAALATKVAFLGGEPLLSRPPRFAAQRRYYTEQLLHPIGRQLLLDWLAAFADGEESKDAGDHDQARGQAAHAQAAHSQAKVEFVPLPLIASERAASERAQAPASPAEAVHVVKATTGTLLPVVYGRGFAPYEEIFSKEGWSCSLPKFHPLS